MKSFYQTTKGQVIAMWVFGLIAVFAIPQAYSNTTTDANGGVIWLFILLVMFFLVFYIIGWRNNKKKN